MAAKTARSKPSESGTYVALLRGINVGGKNSIPMRDLVAMFEDIDCANVRTYIQSGNVIFTASASGVKKLPGVIAEKIADRFDFQIPVVIRSARELEQVAASNPYLARRADPVACHVAFLADIPNATHVAGLDANRSPGDSFTIQGKEIYLHLPNGAARSKLTNAWFDSKLRTISTVRNWRTVLKLMELSKS